MSGVTGTGVDIGLIIGDEINAWWGGTVGTVGKGDDAGDREDLGRALLL